MAEKKEICPLGETEYNWVKGKIEKEVICKQRRTKILEALMVWAAVGGASAVVAAITGAARIIWDHMRS